MPARRLAVVLAGFGLALSSGFVSWGLLSADDEPPPRKLAFLVGVKKYSHADLKDLEFPENDVKELGDVLKGQRFEVTAMSTSASRTDAAHFPDVANIRQQLAAVLKDASKRDLILVCLAGHGLQPTGSSQGYFCPHDANPSERNGDVAFPETLLSIGEILTRLRESGIGRKMLMVDACRDDPQVRGGRRGGALTQVDVSALPPQTGVLLSCSPGEFSFESQSYGTGHGAFFYEVIEGLKGAAKDPDGEISWEDLRSFVRKRVPLKVRDVFGTRGGDQNPNEIGNLNGPPIVLARTIVSQIEGRKLAFLVGVDHYEASPHHSLYYAEADVIDLGTVLSSHGFDVLTLTTKRGKESREFMPTGARIREQLEKVLKKATNRDLILIAFSCHGMPLGFVPCDGRPDRPETLIAMSDILKLVATSEVGRTIFLSDVGDLKDGESVLPHKTGILFGTSSGECAGSPFSCITQCFLMPLLMG